MPEVFRSASQLHETQPDFPYRPEIDGLRGLAVAAVVLFHAFPQMLPGGFVGVDVFFVISGFLITGIILSRLREGTFGFGWFYSRRIRRIVPALLVVLLAGWALGWFESLPSEYSRLSWHVLSASGFFSNITLWSEASYFDSSAESKPLLHLWSLAVEEQFYLLWPLVLVLAWRWNKRVVVVTASLLALSFAINLALTEIDPAAAFYLPFGRFWELLCGALLCRLPTPARWRRRSGRLTVRDGLSLLGLSMLAMAALLIDRSSAFPGWWATLPVAGTSLLIACGGDALANRALLSRTGAVGLGLVSYPLYLWHWPLLSFAYIAGLDETAVAARLGLILLALVLAWATFKFVEVPIRSRHRRLRLIGIVGGLAVVSVAAASTLDGAAFRLPKAVLKIADYTYDYKKGARFETCWLKEHDPYDGFSHECLQTSNPERAVFLWGDSHAARLYPGLRRAVPRGVDVLEAVRSACAPILGGGEPTCLKSNRFVIEQLHLIKPGTVVLFGVWSEYGSAWENGDPMVSALQETLRQIRSAGVGRIVVLGPAPLWNRPLPRLIASAWLNHPEWPRIPERMQFGLVHRAQLVDQRMKALLSGSTVSYVSAMDVLCDGGGCLTLIPGSDELSTWDHGHFTNAASDHVARALARALDGPRGIP